MFLKHIYDDRSQVSSLRDLLQRRVGKYSLLRDYESEEDIRSKSDRRSSHSGRSRSPATRLLLEDEMGNSQDLSARMHPSQEGLTLKETAMLSFEFCMLWVCTLELYS